MIQGRKKTKAQLEAELETLRRSKLSEGFVLVFNNLIRWGAIVLLARYAYLAIETLAGKTTFADVAFNFLANVEVSVGIAWTGGILGVLYGMRQKKLRKDTIERLQTRIQTLESTIDSNRSTSNLTLRGDTRPEDRI